MRSKRCSSVRFSRWPGIRPLLSAPGAGAGSGSRLGRRCRFGFAAFEAAEVGAAAALACGASFDFPVILNRLAGGSAGAALAARESLCRRPAPRSGI